jgi:ribosomal protein S18 acetylase RimI-like enzyme
MPDLSVKNFTDDEIAEHLSSVIELGVEVFGDKIQQELESACKMLRTLLTVAYSSGEVVGFKIGFMDVPMRFYSSTGAVKEGFRKQGIASRLMEAQHLACKEIGFKIVRTETKNDFPAMINLNLKHGFRIIGTYTDHRGEPKIILEKKL